MEQILTTFITAAVAAFGGFAFQKARDMANGQNALNQGVKYLLKDRITQSCEHWIIEGYCASRSREVIGEMFRVYTELGGNSYVHDLVSDVYALPYAKKEGE